MLHYPALDQSAASQPGFAPYSGLPMSMPIMSTGKPYGSTNLVDTTAPTRLADSMQSSGMYGTRNQTWMSAAMDPILIVDEEIQEVLTLGQTWQTAEALPLRLAPSGRFKIIKSETEKAMASEAATLTPPVLITSRMQQEEFSVRRFSIGFTITKEFQQTGRGHVIEQHMMHGIMNAVVNTCNFNVIMALLRAHDKLKREAKMYGITASGSGRYSAPTITQVFEQEIANFDMAHKSVESFAILQSKAMDQIKPRAGQGMATIVSKNTEFFLKNAKKMAVDKIVQAIQGGIKGGTAVPIEYRIDDRGMRYFTQHPIELHASNMNVLFTVEPLQHSVVVGEFVPMEAQATATIPDNKYSTAQRAVTAYNEDADAFEVITLRDGMYNCRRFNTNSDGKLTADHDALAAKLTNEYALSDDATPEVDQRAGFGKERSAVKSGDLHDPFIFKHTTVDGKTVFRPVQYIGDIEDAYLKDSTLDRMARVLQSKIELTAEQKAALRAGEALIRSINTEPTDATYWASLLTPTNLQEAVQAREDPRVEGKQVILHENKFARSGTARECAFITRAERYQFFILPNKDAGSRTKFPVGFANWRGINTLANCFDEEDLPTGWNPSIFKVAAELRDVVKSLHRQLQTHMPNSPFFAPANNYLFNRPTTGLTPEFLSQEVFFANLIGCPSGPLFVKNIGTVAAEEVPAIMQAWVKGTVAVLKARLANLRDHKTATAMPDEEQRKMASFINYVRTHGKTLDPVQHICQHLLAIDMTADSWNAESKALEAAIHPTTGDLSDMAVAQVSVPDQAIINRTVAEAKAVGQNADARLTQEQKWRISPLTVPLDFKVPTFGGVDVDHVNYLITKWDSKSPYHMVPLCVQAEVAPFEGDLTLLGHGDPTPPETKTGAWLRSLATAATPASAYRHLPIAQTGQGVDDESERYWSALPTRGGMDQRTAQEVKRRRRLALDDAAPVPEWKEAKEAAAESGYAFARPMAPIAGIVVPGSGVLESDNMLRRFAHFAAHADPVTGIIARMLAAQLVCLQTFDYMADNDIPVPFNFVLFRPFIQVLTDAVICLIPGPETGFSYWAQSDLSDGFGVPQKQSLAHYSLWTDAHVHKPKNVYLEPNFQVTGYERGCNLEFYKDQSEIDQAEGPMPSVFCFLTSVESTINRQIIDMTGRWHASSIGDQAVYDGIMQTDGKTQQYSSARFYSQIWKFATEQNNKTRGSFNQTASSFNNTVCSRGAYNTFNLTTMLYDVHTPNSGHLGPTYRGCHQLRRGAPERHAHRKTDAQDGTIQLL